MTRWSDEQIEILVSHLLRAGVLLSAALVLMGLALAVAQHQIGLDVHQFHAPSGPVLPSLTAMLSLDGIAIVQLGLLCLVATPITRVAVCVVSFLLESDWLYTALTTLVLAVLAFSLFS